MSPGRVLLALTGVLLAWALFFGGGDSSDRLVWIGGAAVVLAALSAAAAFDRRVERPHIDRLGAGCAGCFAALVAWQGISIVWSLQPDRSWDYVNRGLVYLALVLAYALLAKGIPALYPDYGRLARLRSPIGFWNALALLGDFALVLGLWRAAQRRVDGVLLVFVSVLSVLLAYSRGGIVIAVIAAAAWLALDRRRLESLVALVLGGGGALAVAGIALALPGITDDGQSHSARVHDGRLFLATVVVAAAAVGVAGRSLLRLEPGPAARRRATLVLLVVIGVACAAGVVAAALHSTGSTTASAAGEHCTQGARRLACGSSDARLDWWKQAWQSFEDKPLAGTGAASFQLAHRLRRAEFTRPVTEPHNFALQMLGE